MGDRPQRSLRPRKPYPYLPPDTEDPDQVRYPRLNYNKETVSPAMELNTNAKTLVKFFNSVNRALRQSQKAEEVHSHSHGKHESVHANKQTHKGKTALETHPKADLQKKTFKEDFNKKDKELTISKNQHQGPTITKPPPKNDPSLQKYRFDDNYCTQSVNILSRFGQSVPANLMAQMGILFDPTMLNMLQPPQNPNQAAEKALAQRKIFLNQNQFYQNKPKPQPETTNQKPKDKDNKLFGRSAYHVAIAYHIHLKKIKDNGQLNNANSECLDPTYFARKLKGDQIRSTPMEEEY